MARLARSATIGKIGKIGKNGDDRRRDNDSHQDWRYTERVATGIVLSAQLLCVTLFTNWRIHTHPGVGVVAASDFEIQIIKTRRSNNDASKTEMHQVV